jgi:hypothetical protein
MATASRSSSKDDAANTPPQESGSEVSQDSNEFVVLTGAFVMALDKEAKKVQRFARGQKVKLDPEIHDIERLLGIKAVGRANEEGAVRYPTAAGLSVAAAEENQANPPVPADNGAVQLDDGGAGSDPANPPTA